MRFAIGNINIHEENFLNEVLKILILRGMCVIGYLVLSSEADLVCQRSEYMFMLYLNDICISCKNQMKFKH